MQLSARRLFLGAVLAQLVVIFLYHMLVERHLQSSSQHSSSSWTNNESNKNQTKTSDFRSRVSKSKIDDTASDIRNAPIINHGHQQQAPTKEEITAFAKKLPKQLYKGKKDRCNSLPKPCFLYMHIGKTGGSSFAELACKIANTTGRHFEGYQHFDWSFAAALGSHVEVLTLLREPVSRAVSHFHFVQDSYFGRDSLGKAANMTLSSYFSDPTKLMFETRDIWQDGQAAVSWLTGTHIAAWAGAPRSQVDKRERLAMAAENMPLMLHLAADRLEETLWFGLLEDMDRSLELLRHVVYEDGDERQHQPLVMPKKNVAKIEHKKATALELATLAELIPQDLWLYEYAKRLFEARWKAYEEGGAVTLPPRPLIPEIVCHSFRFNLTCTSGFLKGVHLYVQ